MRNRIVTVLAALVFATLSTAGCTPAQVAAFHDLEPDGQRVAVEHVIREAAAEMGADPELMVRIARCESGLRPDAKNRSSSASGLYQFLDTTWARQEYRLVDRGYATEPLTPADVWNPIAAARVAANVVAEGGLSWWNESRHCWGR